MPTFTLDVASHVAKPAVADALGIAIACASSKARIGMPTRTLQSAVRPAKSRATLALANVVTYALIRTDDDRSVEVFV